MKGAGEGGRGKGRLVRRQEVWRGGEEREERAGRGKSGEEKEKTDRGREREREREKREDRTSPQRTSSPKTQPISCATLLATVVAATLLGWVQAITWFSEAQPDSHKYWGSSTGSAARRGEESVRG